MRIWYQSYVDYDNGKIYWDRLRAHLKTIVDEGTEVEVHGITPHNSYAHPIVEMRCAREVICNAVRAEREGYDAFVVGHFQDAGLYEARSVVNIPVVALGEASMLYSLPARPARRHCHDQYPLHSVVPPPDRQIRPRAPRHRRACDAVRAGADPQGL